MTAEALFEMDGQLPARQRDAFVHQDLYPALELISADWERLPLRSAGFDRYRVHIARGRAVHALRLLAELDPDGAISVTSISVDLSGPEDWSAEDGDPTND